MSHTDLLYFFIRDFWVSLFTRCEHNDTFFSYPVLRFISLLSRLDAPVFRYGRLNFFTARLVFRKLDAAKTGAQPTVFAQLEFRVG